MVLKKCGLILTFLLSMLTCTASFAEYKVNLTPGVTPISQAQFGLHMTVFWICVGIAVVVFSVMFYSMIAYRKSRGVKPAQFHEHTTVEIIWGIIPLIILIVIAIPATRVLVAMDNKDNSEMTVKITGYQWKWQYEYIDEGVKYFSNLSTPLAQINNEEPKGEHYLLEVDKPLVVPVNKKIRFLVTANDVIHSWWVPALGVKRDAVPGFIYEAWATIQNPGTYRGQCAELCGVHHGFMPIVVEAKTQEDYDKWLADQKSELNIQAAAANKLWTKEELMDKGQKNYLTYCAACHQVGGQGMPPTFPALKGSKVATGPVDKHIQTVLHGVAGTAMQAFGTQLDDTEIASIITYERNAWGNNTGDTVQPSDIKAARGGKVSTGKGAELATPTPVAKAAIPAPPVEAVKPAVAAKPSASTETTAPGKDMTREELIKTGEAVYLKICAVCHKADGSGMPPVFPALNQSAIVNGPVADHIHRVLKGVPGTAMQAFGLQLTDAEIAAVITYERNAWNGGKGVLVQPQDIAKARSESN